MLELRKGKVILIMISIEVVLNTILISIPEAFLSVCISLIFLRRKDFFSRKLIKDNMVKITLFVVIPLTLFSVILYNVNMGLYLRMTMNILCLTFLIYISLGYLQTIGSIKKNTVNLLKVLLASSMPILLLYISEVILILLLQYLFNFDMSLIKSSVLINLIFSLPIRIITFFVVYMYYTRCNVLDSFILKIVWEEKKHLRKFIYIQVLVNTILFFIIYNKFVVNNILKTLEVGNQYFIVFFVLMIVILEILLPWFLVLNIRLKQGEKLERSLE